MVATHLYLRGWWTSVFEAKPDLYSVFRGRQGPYLKKKTKTQKYKSLTKV